jgi:predicted transposase YdaD
VLADYLQEREKEVETIMMTLFSQEEATRRYGIECRKEGREEGREEGRKEGREEGREEGHKEGNIRAIHNLMETMSLTAEKAMDALRIPPQEREHYAEAIKSM